MPLLSGGRGEKNAIRMSADQLHRKGPERERNLCEKGGARGIALEEYLDREIGRRTFDASDNAVGLQVLLPDPDRLRAGVFKPHLVERSKDHMLLGREAPFR